MNALDKTYETNLYLDSFDYRTIFGQLVSSLKQLFGNSNSPDIKDMKNKQLQVTASANKKRKYRLILELEYDHEKLLSCTENWGSFIEEPDLEELDKTNKRIKEEFIYYVNEHLGDDNLTHDNLARKLGLCRSLYYKKIKELVGVTPNEYLKNLRIKEAARLLTEQELPVMEVMGKVGFKDPKYFRDCFKKVYGLSPVKFRDL